MGYPVPLQMVLLAAAAALTAAAVMLACVLVRRLLGRGLPARIRPACFVVAVAVVYAAAFSVATVARHNGLATHGLDLGYYANVVYNFGHGHIFRQSVSPVDQYNNHLEPLLAVLGPLSYIFPDAAYLLVVQALAVAAGIVLVFYVARPAAGTAWPAALLALSFALSPGLHGATFYDFHSRALGVPLVLAALLFYSRGRFRAGLVTTVLLALTQDELALHAIPLAVYGGLATGRRRPAFIAAAALAVYFGVVALWLYPKLTYLRFGARPVYEPLTKLGPALYAGTVWREKLAYLGVLVLPAAAFLPGGGAALLTVITPLAIPAFSSLPTVFHLGWQYPLTVLPFVYGAAALGLRRWVTPGWSRRRRLLVAAACVAAVAIPAVCVAWMAPTYYRWALAPAFTTPRVRALHAAAALVPPGVPVVADDVFIPHLANRRFAYTFYPNAYPPLEPPPEVMLLARQDHPPRDLRVIFRHARTWGLGLAACDGDYALFRKGKAALPADELFRRWYSFVEDYQCSAVPGKPCVADRAAHDGRALYTENIVYCELLDGYAFPAGKYRLAFGLRLADPVGYGHCVMRVELFDLDKSYPHTIRRYARDLGIGPEYRWYRFAFDCPRPFRLKFMVFGVTPYYFDGVRISSTEYTLPKTLVALAPPMGPLPPPPAK